MKNRYVISVLAAFVLLSGCIMEDRSDCTCDVLLSFVYTGDGSTDIFPEKIDKVNLYVYSADGHELVTEYEFGEEALAAEQGCHLHLPPGDYRLVCWGNAKERTHIHTPYEEAKVAESVWFRSDDAFYGSDALYFSDLEITVPETLQDVVETCRFESSHIDVLVKLKGFKGALTPSGSPASISVVHQGCPAYTDFFNNPSDEKCSVTPMIYDDPDEDDSYILEYNVLRFAESEETSLAVLDAASGNEVYRLHLADFIARNGIEIDGRQEAVLAIRITLGPVGVDVVEWNIEEVGPGFDKE